MRHPVPRMILRPGLINQTIYMSVRFDILILNVCQFIVFLSKCQMQKKAQYLAFNIQLFFSINTLFRFLYLYWQFLNMYFQNFVVSLHDQRNDGYFFLVEYCICRGKGASLFLKIYFYSSKSPIFQNLARFLCLFSRKDYSLDLWSEFFAKQLTPILPL